VVHPESIAHLGLIDGAYVRLDISGIEVMVVAHLDETIPQEVLLVPRSMGVPIHEPTPVKVALVEKVVT
jgi:anaerobic selenocysteine-containing dehydrogenase